MTSPVPPVNKINIDETVAGFSEDKFNELYEELIETNPNKEIKVLLPKPTDTDKKKQLYTILTITRDAIGKEPYVTADGKQRAQAIMSLLFKEIYLIQDKFQNQRSGNATLEGAEGEKLFKEFVGKEPFTFQLVNDPKLSTALKFDFLPFVSTLNKLFQMFGRLNMSDTDQAKDAKITLQKQIQDAKTGVSNEFSLMSAFKGTDDQKNTARIGIMTGAAVGLWAIVAQIQKSPALTAMAMSGMAVIGVGSGGIAVAVIGAVAVGYYAVLAIKVAFAKYYKMMRTLDEFTILLHKIQKMVRLTVFISSTYNFDINIDEIVQQLKIIFTRFDKMLKEDDYKKIKGQIEESASPNLEEAATKAISEGANNAFKDDVAAATETTPAKSGGQAGGAWEIGKDLKRLMFDVELWNSKLNDDVVKLNIYLTTAMGEFSIVLNVIQMNMIAEGLGIAESDKKAAAIKQLTEKNAAVKDSSEFMKMRIGILLHDILKLRIDIGYCSRTGTFTATTGDLICLEYVEIDSNGSRITTYRRKLHDLINRLCDRLLSDDAYDAVLRQKIMEKVVEPYLKLLEKSKFSVSGDNATQNATLQKSFTLDPAALKGLTDEKRTINEKMDEKIKVISEKVKRMQPSMRGGGFLSAFFGSKPQTTSLTTPLIPSSAPSPSSAPPQSQPPAPTTSKSFFEKRKDDKEQKIAMRLDRMIQFLMDEPYMLMSDDALTTFLRDVYDFSKEESKTTQKEVDQARNAAKDVVHVVPPPPAAAIVPPAPPPGAAIVPPAPPPAPPPAASPTDNTIVQAAPAPPGPPGGGARYRYSRKRIRKSKSAAHTSNRKHKYKYKTSKYRRHY